MLEVQVHSSLRNFLRQRGESNWPHYLTMARLVARALRLGRPALIQTGTTTEQYALSYLTNALLWHGPVILVTTSQEQQRLIAEVIPPLQAWLETKREFKAGDRWLEAENFSGILLTTISSWLEDRLHNQGRFPKNIPTLIDGGNELEELTRHQLTHYLSSQEWEELMLNYVAQVEQIRNVRIQLTKAIFSRPQNPYECYLLDSEEQESLRNLLSNLAAFKQLPSKIEKFWQRWQSDNYMLRTFVVREKGQFTLHIAPGSVAPMLSQVWQQQPFILIGKALDRDTQAEAYRQRVGLADLTCLKFPPNSYRELPLYLPERLPLPNNPQYKYALTHQVRALVRLSSNLQKPIVILIGDVPLKAQIATILASEFGSKVQVEKTVFPECEDNNILVCGWEFWRNYQDKLPTPQLLVIATLPIPSLENPLVASRVAYYKSQRQDWFRLYLLPEAVRELQLAVIPVREAGGGVALLDNRVNHRSYGSEVLAALEPFARINYLDVAWLG
ncbi:MAG: helicase C-terminal domain-containing protein [Spirulinaceae cyanobacterium]